VSLPLPRAVGGRIVLGVDVTPWLRRTLIYGRSKNTAQLIPGWRRPARRHRASTAAHGLKIKLRRTRTWVRPRLPPPDILSRRMFMNIALWIIAGLLTAVYLVSGLGKLFIRREKMAGMADAARWVLDVKPGTLKTIGALEILGAAGLILPALLGIAPILVPLAATGLTLIMTGAMIMRIRRGETKAALVDGGYLALTAFVAIGRFALAPFAG
jgi:hypothetical protein